MRNDLQDDYDFYRCNNCKNILTWDEEQAAKTTGNLCECGGVKYNPTNPTEAEWGNTKVLAYCAKYGLEREPAEVASEGLPASTEF